MAGVQWRLEIRPRKGGAILAILAVWLFIAGVLALLHVTMINAMAFLWLVLPFPVLITFYGLKTALHNAGRIQMDAEGFSITHGLQPPRYYSWAQVDKFFIGRLGASPVYEGRPVARFTLRDTEVVGLPDNLGLDAQRLVLMMERLRKLAGLGWPRRPRTPDEVLQAVYADLDGQEGERA